MKCKNCNSMIEKNLAYCGVCGAELPRKSNKKKIIIAIVAVCCCLALILGVILSGILLLVFKGDDIINSFNKGAQNNVDIGGGSELMGDILGDENENKPDKDILIDRYGTTSQEQFVSCQGGEVQEYPEEIVGIISTLETDLNNDGEDELITMRVGESDVDVQSITAEIYVNDEGNWVLSAAQPIYDINYYASANIYLFYSDYLSEYCIISESASIGSMAGTNYWTADIYSVSEEKIELYKRLEKIPMVEKFADFDAEFEEIGVPFAKYCTEFENEDNASESHLLCEVEHEIYGDYYSYNTRNHKLRIIDTTDKTEDVEEGNSETVASPVPSEEELFKSYVEENLTVNDTKDPLTDGVFNILVKDFDNDKTKEMVTFSVRNDESSGAYLTISLYDVKNGVVMLSDSSAEVNYPRVGIYGTFLCATTENDSITLYKTGWCSGGSQYIKNVLSYKINDGEIQLVEDYYLYSYPRYERLEGVERVSGETYSSIEEFETALEKAGYTDAHFHKESVNAEGIIGTELKDNHIFTIVDDMSMATRYQIHEIYNNTNFIEE